MTSRNSTSSSEFSFIVRYFGHFGAYNADPFVAYEFRLFGGYTLSRFFIILFSFSSCLDYLNKLQILDAEKKVMRRILM
jgi:hypothetical protein